MVLIRRGCGEEHKSGWTQVWVWRGRGAAPEEWVDSSTRTFWYPSRWRSGWWPSASATSPMRPNISSAALKFRACSAATTPRRSASGLYLPGLPGCPVCSSQKRMSACTRQGTVWWAQAPALLVGSCNDSSCYGINSRSTYAVCTPRAAHCSLRLPEAIVREARRRQFNLVGMYAAGLAAQITLSWPRCSWCVNKDYQ